MIKRFLLTFVVLCALSSSSVFAQATKIQASGTLPVACSVGNIYLKTGTSAGFYICLTTNIWTGPLTVDGITALTGDVTATGPGSVSAPITNDAVTNAKLANMAQATVKIRASGAGTGDPIDGTANQVSTILDSATDPFLRTSADTGITQLTGDATAGPGSGSQALTLSSSGVSAATYGDATHVAQIAVDAKGRVTSASNIVISGGGGGSSDIKLLQTYTPSGASSVDITSQISSTYDTYQIILDNITTSANTRILVLMSTNNGSTWDTAAVYDSGAVYGYPGNLGGMTAANNNGNFPLRDIATTISANGSYDGSLLVHNPNGAKNKIVEGNVYVDDNGVGPLQLAFFGRYRNTTAVTAIQVKPESGTFTGTISFYGFLK